MKRLNKLLADAPGTFGLVARIIDDSLPSAQPAISIPAALVLFASLKSGRVIGDTGIHPNLYVCTVCDSGSGKSRAHKAIEKYLAAANIPDLLCGVPASDSGLLSCLQRNPRQLLLWDEFGLALSDMTSNNKASWEARILSLCMMLYSGSGEVTRGKEYAERDRVNVDKPFFSIFGASTQIRFFGSLDERFVHDGFLSRWLTFFPEEEKPRSVPKKLSILKPIADCLAEIEQWEPEESTRGNLRAAITPKMKPLEFPDGKASHDIVIANFNRQYSEAPPNSIERVFWTRAVENYYKVLIACCESNQVSVADVYWASELTNTLLERMIVECKTNLRASDKGTIRDRFLALFAPGERILKSQLTKKAWHLNLAGRERKELIDELLDADLLKTEFVIEKDSRRKSQIYYRA